MIHTLVEKQRAFFETDQTKDINFRRLALLKLRTGIKKHESEILEALKKDLCKAEFESYMTEIGMVLDEIRFALNHMESWAKKKYVWTPISQFPSVSFVMSEPYGVTLIMAPWNYPFQLCLSPLIGALAAGNTAVLKPSELAPATSEIIAKLIKNCFEEEYVAVVEGDADVSKRILEERFDYIFFTGGVSIGRIVMQAAAKHLTPVSLELGGKSPCIIDRTADLKVAARRLMFGKIVNAGQTCVAPDYIFVHEAVRDAFVQEMKKTIAEFLGEDPLKNENYPKIINARHFNRIIGYLTGEEILAGGEYDAKTLKIAPTLLNQSSPSAPVMKEEIFGPILPVISYTSIQEVIRYIRKNEKPLALYLFTTNKKLEEKVLGQVSFGGGCINDTIIHVASPYMGFGGVGNSGMGAYHGKLSFETFSHKKSIVKKANFLDIPMRYHPYTKQKYNLVRKFLK
ncbi:MAG: aldehyde dehydrogenase [Lachnospiraceae bacterium]|nr:aldehyde dehydrogenase [Lachnospiraceae bacterium]